MRKILLGSVLVALSAGTALATDLPAPVYKAPAVAPAAWSWAGFYVGGEVGGKWTRDEWTATSLRDGAPTNGAVFLPIDSSSPTTFATASGRFGGFAGYNWQLASQFVVGIESDWAWANNSASAPGFPGCALAVCTGGAFAAAPSPAAGGDITSVTERWDASIRGRLGFLVVPNLLLYATGGVAWQDQQLNGSCGPVATSLYCNGQSQPVPAAVSLTNTLIGWTLGAGVEWRVWQNWSVRGEYRYANFGTNSEVFAFGSTAATNGTDNTYRFNVKTDTQIATFGLAYKFDLGGPYR